MAAASTTMMPQLQSELLPLTATQAYLLPTLADPASQRPYKQYWTLTEGIRVKPGLSPRRLERALKRLVRRHDTLRLAFTQRNGEWFAFQRAEDDIGLKVEDFGDVTQEDMRNACKAIVDETMEVTASSLCDVRLLRFGKLGDVVFVRIHHAITDGFGMTVLVEDLIKFFLGLPVVGTAMSHLDYLKSVDAVLPEHVGETASYWQELLFPPPKPVPFGRIRKRMPPELAPARVRNVLHQSIMIPTDRFVDLRDKANSAGATFFTALVASLCDVIGEATDTDDFIGRTVHARATASISTYAGIDLRFPFFRTSATSGNSILDRAKALKAQFETSAEHLSRELAAPVNLLEQKLHADTGIGPQLFVHIASADGRANTSMFRDLFRAEGGKILNVGNIEIERMAFPRMPALSLPSEIALYLMHSTNGVRLELRADGSVFDETELSEIAVPLSDRLRGL